MHARPTACCVRKPPGVAVNGPFALNIPHLFAIGVGLLIAGIVVALIGLVARVPDWGKAELSCRSCGGTSA
jgi:hypothetical protein